MLLLQLTKHLGFSLGASASAEPAPTLFIMVEIQIVCWLIVTLYK